MKKVSVFAMLTIVFVLLATLSGCGGGVNEEDFISKVAGDWQRNGNLQDLRLKILDDGSWTNKELKDGTWEIVDQGVISYDEEYKTFNFENDNKFYPVEYSSDNGEVLHYRNDNYYRADDSVDGFAAFDGNWYQNGDKNSDYYSFENGEWKWYEPQDMAFVSVNNGNLAWDGATGELLAMAYADGEVFAAFEPGDTEELMLDDVPYVLLEDITLDEDLEANDYDFASSDSDSMESESPIVLNTFYYLEGEIGGPSFFFYWDDQVDYSENYDSPIVEAVYTINENKDEITIKLPSGELMGKLGIMDPSVLVDVTDGDIGDFYKIPKDN